MKKLNCWEFKKCGREPGGAKVNELGVCPATIEVKLHGTHGGKNAGRACWVVAGSMCGGKVQGTFAQKYGNCVKCDFFQKLKEEEGVHYELSATLLAKLTGVEFDESKERTLNCWEFKKCGREPGGAKVNELGVCPATIEVKLHGTHGGKNAGRACWVVAGSMCGGKVQGTFAQKYGNCVKCDFFQRVKIEEREKYELSATLLAKLTGELNDADKKKENNE